MNRIYLAVFWLTVATVLGAGCDNQSDVWNSIPQPSDLELIVEPRLSQAIEDAQKTIAKKPRSANAWGRLGNIYLIHEWDVEAAVCYRRAVERKPREFRWHYYLGRSVVKTNPTEAAEAFARAIALDEKYAPVHVHYASALRTLKRFDEAKRHLERAAKLDPQNPYAELWLGELAFAARQFELARAHLQDALALNPEQSEAHAILAQVYMALGDKQTAMGHAQAARKPSKFTAMPDALWGEVQKAGMTKTWFAKRGNHYLREGELKRAIAELEVAVSGEEKDPEIWLSYGTALLHVKRDPDALMALERALAATGEKRATPETMEKLYLNLGVAYTRAGNKASAEQYLRAAWKLNPASFDAAYNLAILYYSQERVYETIDFLEKARKLQRDPRVLGPLATLYRQMGIFTAAEAVEAELAAVGNGLTDR